MSGQTLQGSFSAVSKPMIATKYALETSRRDLHNTRLRTAESQVEKSLEKPPRKSQRKDIEQRESSFAPLESQVEKSLEKPPRKSQRKNRKPAPNPNWSQRAPASLEKKKNHAAKFAKFCRISEILNGCSQNSAKLRGNFSKVANFY